MTPGSMVPEETAPMKLALCTATFKRPDGLRRLLDALDAMEPTDLAEVTVVIVDNDADEPAAWVRDRTVLGTPVVYASESQRGITFARNKALQVAAGVGADWIGWLDDDEAPRPNWLRSIVETQHRTGADVVAGPAEPVFEADASEWIVDTGAFGTERFRTDAEYPYFHTRTSGVIVRSSVIPSDGFDNRMALSGGSDRLMFTQIHRAGGSFRWDDNAVVDEWVPNSRVTAPWLIRRWFRVGVTRSLTMLYLDSPPLLRRLRRVAGGSAMALSGSVGVIGALPKGRTSTLAAGRRVLLGVGAAWGALGFYFEEYQKVHGT